MTSPTVSIAVSTTTSPGLAWAADRLLRTLQEHGWAKVDDAATVTIVVEPASAESALARRWHQVHGDDLDGVEGAFAIGRAAENSVVVVAGDEQGYIYALLELADIVAASAGNVRDLVEVREYLERPVNSVRAITRTFTAASIDRSWFNDREFWREYLSELAAARINEFSLALGSTNDYLIDRRVEDNYLCFPYPFLLDVDGYEVHAEGVGAAERAENLEVLRFIGAEARRRGIAFGLGLWNHAYRYDPAADTERWPVRGLGPDNHAPYCRDALWQLLREVPDLTRLTVRSHFEGGVPEPTHEFWRVVFSKLPEVGRPVTLDLHLKGVGPELREIVAALEIPVRLSTKYWAEHQALPYHQSSIRENERVGRSRKTDDDVSSQSRDGHRRQPWRPGTGHPNKGATGTEVTSSRSFTRYSYGDYGYDGRAWPMVHRVWPGTQRVLLWGDPELAAGYGRHASFAGAEGIEWFEPLSFLGKKDSADTGTPENPRTTRDLYRDAKEAIADWRKFRYTYRLLGRAGYDPRTPVEELTRGQAALLGPAAEPALRALALGSKVLPLTVATHAPSTACNVYWPEIPTPVPVAGALPPAENPYKHRGWPTSSDFDTRPPYAFGNVSALDPEMFSNAVELADEVRAGTPSGRENPLQIAARLDEIANSAFAALAQAEAVAGDQRSLELDVMLTDARILANLARYYAAAQRTAVGYELRDLGAPMLEWARMEQRAALNAWDEICMVADAAGYVADLPFGQTAYSRGSWRDRRPMLEADLRAVEDELRQAVPPPADAITPAELQRLWGPSPVPVGQHVSPGALTPGQPLPVTWHSTDEQVQQVTLRWRPVNQAIAYSSIALQRDGDTWHGEIPARKSDDPYPVQYHFRIHGTDQAWPFPGLSQDLTSQPYFVVHTDRATTWG